MACRILRNDDGTVNQVLASNNQPSILYGDIRKTMSEAEALLEYAGTFTDEFKKTFNYLEEVDSVSNIYDVNGEVQYAIYDYIMHPEKFFGNSSNFSEEQINYALKSISILNSDKGRKLFDKGLKSGWDLNTTLTELQIPKEQRQLILNLGKTKLDDIITDLLVNYSYAIEINTATKNEIGIKEKYNPETGEIDIDNIEPNIDYIEEYDEQGNIIGMKPVLSERGKKQLEEKPTQYYSNLTVPGGTNYTEQELATPSIVPSIKGHAQFATENGIGWFRSDDKTENENLVRATEIWQEAIDRNASEAEISEINEMYNEEKAKDIATKTRRILEVQSDLFQKGRNREDLATEMSSRIVDTAGIFRNEEYSFTLNDDVYESIVEMVYYEDENQSEPTERYYVNGLRIGLAGMEAAKKEYIASKNINLSNQNQFLQLLNKNNNWVTFFIKSIIQDSAKKGYEKVLFPSGNTASKVEGHTTLERFIKEKEDRIIQIEKNKNEVISSSKNSVYLSSETGINQINKFDNEINQIKQELEKVETEGFGALKPVFNFYENTVANVLKKQGYTPELITDEYGNTWNQVTIVKDRDNSFIQFNETQNDIDDNIAPEVLNQIAERLSKNLGGIPYNIISEVDAKNLLSQTQDKYNGQPAFFYNGQVYLIKDKLNLENVFHEFSHPFIQALKKANSSLFNQLFNTLSQTEEGQKIIRTVKDYYKFDENSEDFKEEVLVRALTTRARNNELNAQESPEFTKFMDKLWYAIKQLMRKVFGKIKIDNLDVNTTLDQLAKMLNNESFEISTESITNSEKAFFNTLKGSVKDLMDKANDTLVQNNIDKLFKLIGSSKQVIKEGNARYPGMAESISKEKLATPFQDESLAISKYQTYTKTNEAPLDLVTYRKNQIEGLVLSLQSYNESIEKIILEVNRSKSDPDSIQTISKNMYFLKILKQTLETFKEIRQDMIDQGVSVSSPIFQLLNRASNNAEDGINVIYQENKKALPGVLAPHLKGINEVLIKEFNKVIDEMRTRGATTEMIAAKERERDSYLRDENTLAKVMVGETPEPAGLGLSTLVESAVSSPDELISSFALYVKEALIDVEINTTKNFNDFLADTRGLLKAAGLDDFKLVSKLGKIITYTEELGYTDPKTGEFKTHKVHTFLNKFKGYEIVLSKYRYDIDKALEADDLELAATLEVERQEWKRTYMHDKWVPDVYKMYDVFKKTYVNSAGVTVEIGKMAKERYDKIMEDINNGVKLIEDELERIEIQNRMKIDTLWVEYKKLFSKYDDNGNFKTGDEMAITETLLEYRAERKKYFEWESDEDPESMPILRFKKARSLFEEQLLTKYDKTDEEYKTKLQEWDDMNTRKVIDKQFYTDKALILEEINAIYNSISGTFAADSKIVEETKQYWNLIIDQLYAYRDEENHPNGILVSKEKIAEIKKAQEKIQELQDMIRNGNGLSKSEKRTYTRLKELADRGIDLSTEDYDTLQQLEIRSNFSTIPKGIKDELKKKYNELANLQSKKATDYYLEVYNHQIDLHNDRLTAKGLPVSVKHFDRFNIDDFGTDRGFAESMMKKDPEFKKWFMANHIEVERWDDELQMNVMRFERLFLWNQIEPRDEKYKKMMTFLNTDGQRVWIWGMPSLAYYKQNIKPEFATEEIIGETIDNRGNYLPRANVANSPYINQEYIDLKNNNRGAFDLLEKIKEYHLKFQEKANPSDRLWMQVPRYEKTSKELTETNKLLSDKTSAAKTAIRNFVNKFKPNAEDTDEGLGIEDKFKLTKLDFFDNDEQKIHISGKTLMDDDQVSLDVITSVLRHMHSIERANKLSEIEPIAKALMELLNDPKNAPKDITTRSWYHWITQKVPVFANKKGENIRAKAIKGLIDRTFYNVQQTGFGSDAIVLQKLSKVMMQAASFGFFALDIPSGIKNRFGQQLQQTIELAAGTSYDGKSFLKGKMIASKAMMQISASIYSKGKLPYYVQLVNAFDPSQGMAMDKLPEYITRTIYKDVASPTNILMSPRKFMEIEATLEFFFGVMEFTKVEQTINGVTTEIPYHEAFELVDDRLTLKEGIDEKWDLGGSEFKKKRIFIQEKQNILNGVYSKFDQPEGNRYLFYRMFMFLRKFFITGMVNRFGFSGSLFAPRFRRNNAAQSLEMGYWIQSARALQKLLITTGKHWHYMRPSEKGAVFKALTEVALLTILSALIPMLFGWDGDDDDKYEKLRKRQGGPLGSDDFQMGGWLANHLLYQTMSVASENMQYYKVGFYSDMLSNFNLANGPSLQTYGKILGDVIMMVSDDDAAYYSKDVGPYPWQKAESAKILNHVGKAFALTGKTLDPSKAIQDFISAENIYK